MQTKLFTAGALLALSLHIAKAQEVVSPAFGLELGMFNGVYYEHPLGQHFSVGARAGLLPALSIEDKKLSFLGLIPAVEFGPRYYFSGESSGAGFRTGGYVGLLGSVVLPRWILLEPERVRRKDISHWYEASRESYGVVPTIGWVFGIGESSYLGLSAGVGAWWSRYESGTKSRWESTLKDKEYPIVWSVSYGFRL